MIIIDQVRCNLCKQCIKVCHEHCMSVSFDGLLEIEYRYCSTCSQCIAICPHRALSWDYSEPQPYDKEIYPEPIQVVELLKERRTIRDYNRKKISRSLLEEIAGMAVYVPTHNFDFRIILVDDEKIINTVDRLIYNFSKSVYFWFYKPRLFFRLTKLTVQALEFEYLKARPKLENVIKRNHGFKTKPAAIVFIIGNRHIPLSLESAQYALYNIDLYAQAKGLASRILVVNQMVLNRNKSFRKMIKIKRYERIFGTLTLGYPAVRFRNKVTGKKMEIHWN